MAASRWRRALVFVDASAEGRTHGPGSARGRRGAPPRAFGDARAPAQPAGLPKRVVCLSRDVSLIGGGHRSAGSNPLYPEILGPPYDVGTASFGEADRGSVKGQFKFFTEVGWFGALVVASDPTDHCEAGLSVLSGGEVRGRSGMEFRSEGRCRPKAPTPGNDGKPLVGPAAPVKHR